MGHWAVDTLVSVYPFTRQPDGDEVIIGHLDTAVFLVLPSDALELLDFLAVGKTVGQAQSLYQEKYSEVPDMNDFLDTLERKGFVRFLAVGESDQTAVAIKTSPVILRPTPTKPVRYHFAKFPQSLARRLLSRPILVSCGVLIGLALSAIAVEPSVMPGWSAYFFNKNLTLMGLILMMVSLIKVFLHEMAHLVAARAVGVSSRLGISNRMWVLVAETDMTGIWGVPRKQRYLPLLAGPLLDAVCASALTLILFAYSRGWLVLHLVVFQLSRAMLLTYLLGLLWQCYFFVRTDFYYVVANFFNCKSLMKDTEIFLHNQMARIIPSLRKVDQSHIGALEMQVIRWYALVWLIGRAAAVASLIFIGIPLIWNYYLAIFAASRNGYQANHYAFIDALIMAVMLIPQIVGFWLWILNSRTIRR
ncbi:MAG: hypothetical protein H0V75_16470 [Rubrobacter sp.]|nr:hypothetical protein [Rubrobacter sp.]